MSNQTDHTIVRLRVPPELKQKIEDSAEKNNRSQSAEMVARLEKSFIHTPSSTEGLEQKLNELMVETARNLALQDELMKTNEMLLKLLKERLEKKPI